jgi:regulator of nucleoside diphosphate kinase
MFGPLKNFIKSIGTRKKKMSENIILTTGIYDLIKDHIKSKSLQKRGFKITTKSAKQLTRKEFT